MTPIDRNLLPRKPEMIDKGQGLADRCDPLALCDLLW